MFLDHIDKFEHFWVSLVLFFSIFIIRKNLKLSKNNLEVVAYTIRDVLFIWLLKELFDLTWLWDPEFWDFLADFIGVFIPIYTYFLMKSLNNLNTDEFLLHEWDLARRSFKKTYKIYFILKQSIKFRLKKVLFWKWDFWEDDYNSIKLRYNTKKSFYYYVILNTFCVKDFLKFILKLPIVIIFSTLWVFYTSAKLVYVQK